MQIWILKNDNTGFHFGSFFFKVLFCGRLGGVQWPSMWRQCPTGNWWSPRTVTSQRPWTGRASCPGATVSWGSPSMLATCHKCSFSTPVRDHGLCYYGYRVEDLASLRTSLLHFWWKSSLHVMKCPFLSLYNFLGHRTPRQSKQWNKIWKPL